MILLAVWWEIGNMVSGFLICWASRMQIPKQILLSCKSISSMEAMMMYVKQKYTAYVGNYLLGGKTNDGHRC